MSRSMISRQARKLQTSCPGGLIWYMQKLCSSNEHASGQKNNPWKQDISAQDMWEHKLEIYSVRLEGKVIETYQRATM